MQSLIWRGSGRMIERAYVNHSLSRTVKPVIREYQRALRYRPSGAMKPGAFRDAIPFEHRLPHQGRLAESRRSSINVPQCLGSAGSTGGRANGSVSSGATVRHSKDNVTVLVLNVPRSDLLPSTIKQSWQSVRTGYMDRCTESHCAFRYNAFLRFLDGAAQILDVPSRTRSARRWCEYQGGEDQRGEEAAAPRPPPIALSRKEFGLGSIHYLVGGRHASRRPTPGRRVTGPMGTLRRN